MAAGQTSARALGSRYSLVSLIGSGAMGEVWLADDVSNGEQVAAKLLRKEMTSDTVLVGRFVQERTILVSLDHPNVVKVRDLVVEGDALALIMDYVKGSDLRKLLRAETTIPPGEAVRLTAQVLEALAAAHKIGILHRDVKPDNVLLDDAAGLPEAKLTDFSIARLAQQTTVKMTGVLGTAEYIAPEVFTDEEASPAVDVYGAGIMLYELLSGRTPFAGAGNDYAVANRHVNALPPPIPAIPEWLWQLLASMLDKAPRRRPSAAEAAAVLRREGPSLAGAAKLTPLGPPQAWEHSSEQAADTAGQDLSVRGYSQEQATRDPNATRVKGAHGTLIKGQPSKPAASKGPSTAGAAQVLSPHEEGYSEGGIDDGSAAAGTTVNAERSRLRERSVDVVVRPDIAVKERPSWVKPAVIAAVAVVVAAGAGVAAMSLGHSTKAKATASAVQAPQSSGPQASLPPQTVGVGLSIQRQATFSNGTVTVTITYQVPSGVTVSGPFFEDLQTASGCPAADEVTWSVPAQADPQGRPCGYAVDVASVSSGSPKQVTVSYPVALPSHQSRSTALAALLGAEQQNTDAQLGAIGPSSSAYAPQRLQSLLINVQPPSLGQVLNVSVSPVWAGSSSPDQALQIYNSTLAQPYDTPLVESLTGQSTFAIQPSIGSCSNALRAGANNVFTFYTLGGSSCQLSATIGQVTGTSNPVNLSSPSGA